MGSFAGSYLILLVGLVIPAAHSQRVRAGPSADAPLGCKQHVRPRNNIAEITMVNPILDQISDILDLFDVEDMLSMVNTDVLMTFFAPTDMAIDKALAMKPDLVDRLYESEYAFHAVDLVLNHFVRDAEVCSSNFEDGTKVDLANGNSAILYGSSGLLELVPDPDDYGLDVTISAVDTSASNGVVHIIDDVFLTRWVFRELYETMLEEKYISFLELVEIANMKEFYTNEMSRLTVFAPTDTAFANLDIQSRECLGRDPEFTKQILQSHTLQGLLSTDVLRTGNYASMGDTTVSVSTEGSSVVINGGALVTDPNILAYSGILHGISTVLLPAHSQCSFGVHAQPVLQATDSVMQILREKGLSAFADLIEEAGLSNMLSESTATFTLFAPTDAAFSDLSFEARACYAGKPDAIRKLLRYHMVASELLMNDLKKVQLFHTLSTRRPLLINGLTATDELTQVNDAGIVEGDLLASNGVVHKISRVINYPDDACMFE